MALAAALGAAAPAAAGAQWSRTYEQFYLQAPHNWVFRRDYQAADRLFNAFDYGHAVLYETLWTKPGAPASRLEEREYRTLTERVLVRPPRVPLEEGAIEPKYAQLAPEAKAMFEWAHILHRQLYDVLGDERLDQAARDREVARLLAYYRTRPDLAFSRHPKSMKLMQEQPYSLAFRREYPKFNGLIWAYHWLQVGLYEPLVVGRTAAERQAGVRGTVARFWQMLGDAPRTMPHQMPMTAAVAPAFAARYPEAAIVFDNLHSMHDVISDVLANDAVPRAAKRTEILRAAARFRDDTSYVMTPPAWLAMSRHMGVENMGGPSVGFLPALPAPTVTYGAVMTHDDRTGAMTGFRAGGAADAADAAGTNHAGHAGHEARDSAAGAAPRDSIRRDSVSAPSGAPPGVSHAGTSHPGMAHRESAQPRADTGFVGVQARGGDARGMGVDQATSVHRFDDLPDGGRIEFRRVGDDPAGTAQIRRHLREVAAAFAAGDFHTPGFVHARAVPGTDVMAARRAAIRYTVRDLPRGGEVRIATRDPAALRGVHAFLAFQRRDHRAGGGVAPGHAGHTGP